MVACRVSQIFSLHLTFLSTYRGPREADCGRAGCRENCNHLCCSPILFKPSLQHQSMAELLIKSSTLKQVGWRRCIFKAVQLLQQPDKRSGLHRGGRIQKIKKPSPMLRMCQCVIYCPLIKEKKKQKKKILERWGEGVKHRPGSIKILLYTSNSSIVAMVIVCWQQK